MHQHIRYIQHGLHDVFSQKKYVFFVFIFAIMIVFGVVLAPNAGIIADTLFASKLSLSARLSFIYAALLGITTNHTVFSVVYIAAIALLISLNVAAVVRLWSLRAVAVSAGQGALGVAGTTIAFLGIGCAACGSILLTSVFSILGIGSAITLLPLRGVEFSILAVVLLCAALLLTLHKLGKPKVCLS